MQMVKDTADELDIPYENKPGGFDGIDKNNKFLGPSIFKEGN